MSYQKCVILIDNSNVFIEGQKYSAAVKGLPQAPGSDRDPVDPYWRVDFGKLVVELAGTRTVVASILVGSRPPQNDSVWQAAESHGIKVTVHDRNSAGKEKAVDTELVAQGTELICSMNEPMDLIIVSGDRDFVPLASVARRKKWYVEMAAFSNSYNPASGLAQSVDAVTILDKIFAKITKT